MKDMILAGRPDLAYDLGEIPESIREEGSIDAIATELEIIGSGLALDIRTSALLALREKITREFDDARTALRWLADRDTRLAAWASCACARRALTLRNSGMQDAEKFVSMVEGWVRGVVDIEIVDSAYNTLRPRTGRTVTEYIEEAARDTFNLQCGAAISAWAIARVGFPRARSTMDVAKEFVATVADAMPSFPIAEETVVPIDRGPMFIP